MYSQGVRRFVEAMKVVSLCEIWLVTAYFGQFLYTNWTFP